MTKRPTYEQLTETLTSDAGLSNADAVRFHYFNPAGAYARLRVFYQLVDATVEELGLPSGWLMAYGSLSGAEKQLDALISKVLNGKRIATIDVRLAVQWAERAIERGTEQLEAKRAEIEAAGGLIADELAIGAEAYALGVAYEANPHCTAEGGASSLPACSWRKGWTSARDAAEKAAPAIAAGFAEALGGPIATDERIEATRDELQLAANESGKAMFSIILTNRLGCELNRFDVEADDLGDCNLPAAIAADAELRLALELLADGDTLRVEAHELAIAPTLTTAATIEAQTAELEAETSLEARSSSARGDGLALYEFNVEFQDGRAKLTETRSYRSEAGARARAGALAKEHDSPVDLARAGFAPWADRYMTTASPSSYHAAGYAFERIA